MCQVHANRAQLGQVFQNLTTNALKYRSDQPLRLRYSCELRDRLVEFVVQDNGIGFEMGYANQIFGLFKRLHGREIPGTGIGLAICKKVIEAHGGSIWVNSAPGSGTAFHFTLPAV
jgi:signal transduction histidine kinase